MSGEIDPGQATLVAGVILANIGAIVSAFVSVRVAVERLKVTVDNLEKDVDALAGMIRQLQNSKTGE
jgi:prefoldin subunit 5